MTHHPHAPGRFCGSYRTEDVCFLLKPIQLDPVDLMEKERLIQSGRRHYSAMLSRESLPSPRYLELFHHAFAMGRQRMARGILDLAAIIAARRAGEITLVSLARAGTPVGVVLKHVLAQHFERDLVHYSVSIIRDRGIDANALRFILDQMAREPEGLVFVDGWTGKGVIARELKASVARFNRDHGVLLDDSLMALTDLAGVGIAPSDEDYLIPSSILNATLSGLVSRSVLNEQIGPNDFHGCVYYQEFAPADLSVWFVTALLDEIEGLIAAGYTPKATPVDPKQGQARSARLLATIRDAFGILDENRVKPGLGEATRVLLRRLPERVIIRDPEAPEILHLLQLAREKGAQWQVDTDLPYHAVSLIQDISDA